jgi:pimeloyl-ACP methyl ester carboxylesterase
MHATADRPEIVLFVHGFSSSSKSWGPMLALLDGDERIRSRYELATWGYPTKWVELNILGRIPRLQELGRALGDELDSPRYRDRPRTLVGHSQGGLVIQTYFAERLQSGRGPTLRNVRQAIFFATPNEGSTTGMNLRRLASTLLTNPQEVTLRVLNPDVADLRAVIRERIVAATRDSEVSWRVPIHAFCGLQDNVVPEASARGSFDSVRRVPGTHFSIIKPDTRDDPRYARFADLLLDPGGHAHRFEIDHYETVIRVEPRAREVIQTATPRNQRMVEFSSRGTIRRQARFSAGNRCGDPFTIQYGTRKDGYVVGHTTHPNQAPAAAQGRWEDTGTYFRFDFTPEPGQVYGLTVDVYKGFEEGERDVHFHLGDHSTYRAMRYELDLSAYVATGYVVSQGPHFYLHPEDHEHGELCQTRGAREPLPVGSQTREGIYRWDLPEVRKGIVDLVWDVARHG